MLQHVVSGATPAVAGAAGRVRPLEHMMHRVRLSMVDFNAQDIYQICGVAYNSDRIGMMHDPEFMRGLASAFKRADQTVLSPFQVNLITDTFSKANIDVKPSELAIPEEDMISPESLINMLRQMHLNRVRDERKIQKVTKLMQPLLDEFSPVQLAEAAKCLAVLQCSDTTFMGRLAQRACQMNEELTTKDVSFLVRAMALTRGIQHEVLLKLFRLVEERVASFLPEDYVNTLFAFHAAGPKYVKSFSVLIEAALEHAENIDPSTLTNIMVCFASFNYRNREHIDVFADSLVEKAEYLMQKDLVQAMTAFLQLNLFSNEVFDVFMETAMRYTSSMDVRNIGPLMDICSQLPYDSEPLMGPMMDRCVECARMFNPNQLSDVVEILGTYPPAKEHPLVDVMGKQCRMRVDILGPTPLAKCAKGLANLGYSEPEFYLAVAVEHMRFGFKDFSFLEPILQGLCLSGQATPAMVKVISTYVIPMAPNLSIQELQRTNGYMMTLGCEDDDVYKALAERLRVFVKEVTPDMPEELQLLMQRTMSV